MPEVSYQEKLEAIESKGLICDVCSFFPKLCSGDGGVRGGPNGPIYPPCADAETYDFVSPDKVEEIYRELVEEEG